MFPFKLERLKRYALIVQVLLFLGLIVCDAELMAQSVSATKKLCFPRPSGLYPSPVIDGEIDDIGWTGSFRYLFQNGIPNTPDAIMQGLSDANYVYLSFEVNLDQSFNDTDVIVLVFSPGGGPQNDRRIHIYPVFGPVNYDPIGDGTGAAANGEPRQVDYWNDSSHWKETDLAKKVSDPGWLKNNIRVSSASAGPGNLSWYIEMRIPRNNVAADNGNPTADSGINFPSSGTFGMYVNIVRVNTKTNPKSQDGRHWPEDAPDVTRFLETGTPGEGTWGRGALATYSATASCSGVSIDQNSILSNFAASGLELSLTQPNTLYATAYNDSVNSSGTFVAAEDVSATFRIANWGLGSDFAIVKHDPGSSNPISAVDIPAAIPTTSGEYRFQMTWTLDAADKAAYSLHPHQCVLVELDSTNPGTTFVNKSALTNMTFVDASSPFEKQATIGTTGLRLPEGMKKHEITLFEFTYNTPPELKWEAQMPGAERVGPGQYTLTLEPKISKVIKNVVQPPRLDLPIKVIDIKPRTRLGKNNMMKINVQRGNLITIYARGELEIRKLEGKETLGGVKPKREMKGNRQILTGPNGRSIEGVSKKDTFLLSKRYQPERMIGALIGSWDGFKKTSFLIGAAKTIKVPKGARTLYFAINDTPKEYEYVQQRGYGYRLEVVQTPLKKHFGKVDYSMEKYYRGSPRQRDYVVPLGSNLPTYVICGKQRTNQTLTINGHDYVQNENINCFAYMIKKMSLP